MTGSTALVLAGHGSRHGPGAAAPLFAHADRIRGQSRFPIVRTAFWAQEPPLHDVPHSIPAEDIYVVPVLTSEGYFADEVFPRELGIEEADGTGRPRIHYTPPVGTHPALTDVIERRVVGAVGEDTSGVAVALVGHGTERHERSAEATRDHAARLRQRGTEAVALFLDESPAVAELTQHVSADEVVVVPFFVADGPHTTEDVPAAMGHPGSGETARIEGTTVHYTGAVGTAPGVAGVIVERALEAGATPSPNGVGPHAVAFVEWLEAAGSRTWGELAIEAVPDGFLLRHVADQSGAPASLESVDGPAALRSRVRADDDGRYRPLTGAQSLPRGWALSVRTSAQLVAAVHAVYPNSIGLWARERDAALPATVFRTAATRQSGIYAGLSDLGVDHIAVTAEAVCGRCVRRREWALPSDRPAEGDADGREIPCREPCPFVRSAAQAFADGAIDPTVDIDPAVPAGAFDEPGNEYRVRFGRLRAGSPTPPPGGAL